MRSITYISRYLIAIVALLFSVSCNRDFDKSIIEKRKSNDFNLVGVKYSDDFKNFTIDIKFKESLRADPRYYTIDSIATKEIIHYRHIEAPESQPTLVSVVNERAVSFKDSNINTLILVDLTLSQEKIDEQKQAVEFLYRVFKYDNLYIAFMSGSKVSSTVLVTDYIIKNHFVKDKSGEDKQLYRSILTKNDELNGDNSRYFKGLEYNREWTNLLGKQKRLVVFSDEKVYEDDIPIDDEHFLLQSRFLEIEGDTLEHTLKNNFPIIYISLSDDDQSENGINQSGAQERLKLLCQSRHGEYFESFNKFGILDILFINKLNNKIDYRLEFENPDDKVYAGEENLLQLDLYSRDSLICKGEVAYSIASMNDPIIINGDSPNIIILDGFLITLLLVVIVYLLLQFLYPYISYLIFKKRYIKEYSSQFSSYNSNIVEKACYYCKAPFEKGDTIVVKCKHTTHLDCWQENGYKCPEHGLNCSEGIHYYNKFKLTDYYNAPHFMSWILVSICAAFASWFIFMVYNPEINIVIQEMLCNLLLTLNDIDAGTTEADYFTHIYSHAYRLPQYGFNMGFWLTLAISILVTHNKSWYRRVIHIITVGLMGGVLGFLSFILASLITIVVGLSHSTLLLYLLAWVMMGGSIVILLSYINRTKYKHVMLGASITVACGLLTMGIGEYFNDLRMDSRNLQLITYLIYCLGFALSFVVTVPKSKHYFLQVEGSIKQIDIALFKWFTKIFTEEAITIGKSVDCDLQLSWDLSTNIAPLHAKIVKNVSGKIYLLAVEPGIIHKNKELAINKKIRLFDGDSFQVGLSKFTYIEKDM